MPKPAVDFATALAVIADNGCAVKLWHADFKTGPNAGKRMWMGCLLFPGDHEKIPGGDVWDWQPTPEDVLDRLVDMSQKYAEKHQDDD